MVDGLQSTFLLRCGSALELLPGPAGAGGLLMMLEACLAVSIVFCTEMVRGDDSGALLRKVRDLRLA